MTSPSMMAERAGVTNSQGVFIARLLPPGNYTIEIIASGFQTARNTRPIGMDQHYQPRIVLQTVAGATVEVISSSMTAVDPTSAQTASNYDAGRIDMLPTGRGINAMAALTPGVVTSSSVGGRLQIRGAMTSGNLFLIDGQNLADTAYNNLQYPIISDSIEETQVITGAISAEYGNVDGGVVNTLTKSGGNEFTGLIRIDLSNPAWDALKPYQDPGDVVNSLNQNTNYTIGGYILKDRLWFYISYLSSYGTDNYTIDPYAPKPPAAFPNIGGGAGYASSYYDVRRQFKLTYLINQDHTIIGTYNNSDNGDTHRDYGAGDIYSLLPQFNEFMFWNLAWRATWSPTFTTDIRFGHKESIYMGGNPDGDCEPTLYDYGVRDEDAEGFTYRNGWFSGSDGGDKRNIDTLNIKGSYFFNASGSHELDFGIDYFKSSNKARNEQAPHVYISDGSGNLVPGRRYNIVHGVEGYRYNPTTGQPEAVGSDIWNMWGVDGAATQETYGFYVNDKWKVNNNIALQIGLRWDNYDTKADDTGSIAGASGFSPRLGVTYDLFGDQKWIFKASYCRYNSGVLHSIATATSLVGKAASIEWFYIGPSGYQPLSVIYDRDNYDPNDISYYEDPALNVRINKAMKSPHVDEMQLSATYSFATENYGSGYVTLTGVKKKWGDLMDYRTGWHGTVNPMDLGIDYDDELYIQYWDNEPDAKREYEALEFSAAWQYGNFNLTGNITWSSLKGNYEGETSDSPASGQNLHKMDRWRDNDGNWTEGYDYNILYPYGYMQGHVPIVMRWQADYTHENRLGTTTYGFAYRFDSGSHFSATRTRYIEALNPLIEYGTPEGMPFGSSGAITQFKDNQRRNYAFNARVYHDFSVTHDFNLFKVGGYQVRGFAKLVIYNFFNHQQNISWNTSYRNVSLLDNGNPNWDDLEDLNTPWEKAPNHGRTDDPAYWGAARSYTMSLGIRF